MRVKGDAVNNWAVVGFRPNGELSRVVGPLFEEDANTFLVRAKIAYEDETFLLWPLLSEKEGNEGLLAVFAYDIATSRDEEEENDG